MSWRHRDILEAELHEPKGFTTANNGDSIWKNEQGLSEWTDREVLPAALNFVDASVAPPTTASGDIYVLSLGASIHANWGTVALKDWVRYDGTSWNVITPSKSILCYDKTLDVLMAYSGSVWATVGSGGGGGGDNISNADLTFDADHYADLDGNSWTLGGTSPVGTEKISLQGDTLIKATPLSSGASLEIVDSSNNSKFYVSSSGQTVIANDSATVPSLKLFKDATGTNQKAIELRNLDTSNGTNATIDFKVGATATTAWAQIKATKFGFGDSGIELNNQQGSNLLVRKDYVAIQGSTVIGSEKISLQDDTLVKGSDTSASTTGFKVTDINNNSFLDIRNNGQTAWGGNRVVNTAHAFYNISGSSQSLATFYESNGNVGIYLGTNGFLSTSQSGTSVFKTYRQSGFSHIQLFNGATQIVE